MLIGRRGALAVGGTAVVLGVVGCGRSGDDPEALLDWLRGVDGVEEAAWVSGTDPETDRKARWLRLTLDDGLDDGEVRSLIGDLKEGFADRDDDYRDNVEVRLGPFTGAFYPYPTRKRDADVERVLWLREDGRATSSGYGAYSGLEVIAPSAAVPAIALGLADFREVGRRTHQVRSEDKAAWVQWTDSESLGFDLDRTAVEAMVALQEQYPGLTGWSQAPERKVALWFDPDDITLDEVRKRATSFVDGTGYDQVEIGWGPGRAPAALFAEAFSGERRAVLEALTPIEGVARVEVYNTGEADRLDRVVVRTTAAYDATLDALTKVYPTYLGVTLVRKPGAYIGREGPEVVAGSRYDSARDRAVYRALGDRTGVQKVSLVADRAQLVLTPDVSDADLTAAMQQMAGLPDAVTIAFFQAVDDIGVHNVGTREEGRWVDPTTSPASAAYRRRLRRAWERAEKG